MSKKFERLGMIPTLREFAHMKGVDLHSFTDVEFEVFYFRYGEEVDRRVQEARNDPSLPMSLGALNHFLAEDVIASHLGDEYVERHILDPDRSDLARSYISMQMPKLLKALSLHRVQEMARRLHQLQSFPWFDSVCNGIRTRELSGAAFELDVLWTLKVASPHVQTSVEIGVKGSDYDAFALMDGKIVPVEAKAKDDRTPWSAKTVSNTVRGAAKQLPKGDTGVLFFRIPFAWIGPQLERQYDELLTESTRQSSRIGAVVTVIDKPHMKDDRFATVSRQLHLFATDACPNHIRSYCQKLQRLHDADFTHMAPEAPF